MNNINIKDIRSRSTSIGRWSAIGPYYAMFPLEFAFEVIQKYTNLGDFILDPFAGRGTTLYMGGVLGRKCDGIEINPLGWLYSYVKLNPAKNKNQVINRLKEIINFSEKYKDEAFRMPVFYKYCYSLEVLIFLLSARANLDWQNKKVDATLMSIIVLYLHNKIGQGLSNQMQLTKSMGMQYSIKWWKKNNYISPPQIDPLEFLSSRIAWRYDKGLYEVSDCSIVYGDSTRELDHVIKKKKRGNNKYSLLLTSPPYYSITDYHIDQWLRLWLLGGDCIPSSRNDKHKGRFNSKENYYDLLDVVFSKSAQVMDDKSVVYVRTDARKYTLDVTTEILKKHFPDYKFSCVYQPLNRRSQTHVFNGKSNKQKPGEVDLILIR